MRGRGEGGREEGRKGGGRDESVSCKYLEYAFNKFHSAGKGTCYSSKKR